jgi:pyruvate ferredoxin oxidoreductase gamma subunit
MFEVRVHGRGGQGVVTAAEMLSVAAFHDGLYAQAFPSFGSERTGAPVISYCRIDRSPIRVREPIVRPDAIIVQDPTVLPLPGVVTDLARHAHVIINSTRGVAELIAQPWAVVLNGQTVDVVPAGEIARERIGRPLPNAALLGAFAGLTGQVSLDGVEHAIRAAFSGVVAEANVAAARAAYAYVATTKDVSRAATG